MRVIKRKRSQIFLAIVLGSIYLFCSSGVALALPFGKTAGNYTWYGSYVKGYGTSVINYVQFAPAVQAPDGKKVNSQYATAPAINSDLEFGWYYRYGSTSRYVFYVWVDQGEYRQYSLSAMNSGSHTFDLIHFPGTGTDYGLYIDGVLIKRVSNTGINSSVARVGTERMYTGINNDGNADWGELKRKTSDSKNTWTFWENISDLTNPFENDPEYDLIPNVGQHTLKVRRKN